MYRRNFFQSVNIELPVDQRFKKRKNIIHKCEPWSENQLAEFVFNTKKDNLAVELGWSIDQAAVIRLIADTKKVFVNWAPQHCHTVYMRKMWIKRKNAKRISRKQRDPEISIIPADLGYLVYNYGDNPRHSSRWPVSVTDYFLLGKVFRLYG
jgi:hypothetical protein